MAVEQQRVRDSGEERSGFPVVLPPANRTAEAGEGSDFPRRTADELNTSAHLRIVVEPLPIHVRGIDHPALDPDVIRVPETFSGALTRAEKRLYDYAAVTGAQVKPSSPQFSSPGVITRLCRRLGIAQWLSEKFPVDAYDLTRQGPDGIEKKVCQVRFTRALLRRGVWTEVEPYDPAATEWRRVQAAIGKNAASAAPNASTTYQGESSLGSETAAITARIPTTPGLQAELEAKALEQSEAQRERQIALGMDRKRLGLREDSSPSEVHEMKRLIAAIDSDVKGLLQSPLGGIEVSPGPDGACQVLARVYSIDTPTRLKGWQNFATKGLFIRTLASSTVLSSVVGGAFFNPYSDLVRRDDPVLMSVMGLFMGISLWGIMGVIAGALAGGLASVAAGLYSDRQHKHYLRDSLRRNEPGSLGAVVEPLRDANLEGDIRVTAWNFEKLQVELRVNYKLKEDTQSR